MVILTDSPNKQTNTGELMIRELYGHSLPVYVSDGVAGNSYHNDSLHSAINPGSF